MQASDPHAPELIPANELLAANVRRLRAQLRWSTRAFADHAGISLSFLYRIEHAKHRTVSLATLERLANGFGVHVSCLLSPAESKAPPSSQTAAPQLVASSLVHWRRAREWTQERLSNESGVNRVVIAEVERQDRNVSLDVMDRLARALAIPVANLLNEPQD